MRAVPITSAPGGAAAEFKPGTVDSYLLEGPFVINVSGTGPTTAEGAKFVTKAYELQLPKVKAFSLTPTSAIQSLPADKDGILSRTLLDDSADSTLSNAYFSLTGLLHRIRDISDSTVYTDAGVDLVGQGRAVVYRTRDAAAAAGMITALRAKSTSTPADSPTNLPQASCIRLKTGGYNCAVAAGRWAATAAGDTLADAQQRISAQFTILAKNQ